MILEKKTTAQIIYNYGHSGNNSKKGFDKVWISEESLRENLLDMYRLMCNKYGKANVWNMNADELLEHVDLLINEKLNERIKKGGL